MSTLTLAIDAAVPVASVAGAWLTGKMANKSAVTTADAEEAAKRSVAETLAYDRAKGIFESVIDSLQEQVDRLQGQVDRLQGQLSSERDNNDTLRAQLRETEAQVQALNRTIAELNRKLATLPVDVARQIHETADR